MKNPSKIALVTGANKGIGLETVRQLAQAGYHVYLGARDPQKGETAAQSLLKLGLSVEPLVIDVSNPASIKAAAEKVAADQGRLDVLVNNAGVNNDPAGATTENTPVDRYRETFETNFFGVVETTNAFLPLLKKSDAGRIVNLSSILGSLSNHTDPNSPIYGVKWPSYDISKTMVNAYTVHLASDLRDTNIKVNAAHPGWVKTDLGGQEAPLNVEEGAKTSVWLATLPEDGPTGGYFHLQKPMPW